MELTGELLIQKGFKLNTYDEVSYYEYETKDEETMELILGSDFTGDENIVILQAKEDLTSVIISVDCDFWNMSIEEFKECVEKL